MSNWHSKDGEGAMMKRRQAITTKTTSQDDTNTNNKGDDKHGTRTEGAGDGYSAI